MKALYIWLLLLVLSSCTSQRIVQHFEREALYQQDFTGFALLDAASGEVLVQRNAEQLYTPASNVKILTLATALAWLPQDSLPALAYAYEADTLRLWALAYPELAADASPYNQRIRNTIAAWPGVVELNLHGFRTLGRFGEGWMWDDYAYGFARERSGLPVYRNMLAAWYPDTADTGAAPMQLASRPSFMVVAYGRSANSAKLSRAETQNRYYASPPLAAGDTLYAPLFGAQSLATQLLEDWTGRPVRYHNKPLPRDWGARVWRGEPRDSLLRRMMLPSDNFLAEHLLLMAGLHRYDLTNEQLIRGRARREVLQIDEQQLAWADGSGISHYNLIAPMALAGLLQRLYEQLGDANFKRYFPAGGESGTIRDWYQDPSLQPYVYAKTGTLRHTHCLSGVLYAASGRALVFSIMNNHFRGDAGEYKMAMQRTLELIRSSY